MVLSQQQSHPSLIPSFGSITVSTMVLSLLIRPIEFSLFLGGWWTRGPVLVDSVDQISIHFHSPLKFSYKSVARILYGSSLGLELAGLRSMDCGDQLFVAWGFEPEPYNLNQTKSYITNDTLCGIFCQVGSFSLFFLWFVNWLFFFSFLLSRYLTHTLKRDVNQRSHKSLLWGWRMGGVNL